MRFQRDSRFGLYHARRSTVTGAGAPPSVLVVGGDDRADIAGGGAGGVGVAPVQDHLQRRRSAGGEPRLEVGREYSARAAHPAAVDDVGDLGRGAERGHAIEHAGAVELAPAAPSTRRRGSGPARHRAHASGRRSRHSRTAATCISAGTIRIARLAGSLTGARAVPCGTGSATRAHEVEQCAHAFSPAACAGSGATPRSGPPRRAPGSSTSWRPSRQLSPARNSVLISPMKCVAGRTWLTTWITTGMFRRSKMKPESINAGMKLASSAIWLAWNWLRVAPEMNRPSASDTSQVEQRTTSDDRAAASRESAPRTGSARPAGTAPGRSRRCTRYGSSLASTSSSGRTGVTNSASSVPRSHSRAISERR